MDVVNRGFSGYNTQDMLGIFEELVPSPDVNRIEYLVSRTRFT